MRQMRNLWIMLFTVSMLQGCADPGEVNLPGTGRAKIEITNVEVAPWYSVPEVFVTVKNTGDNTAYWVVLHVTAKDSAGVIVDTGIVTPADYGDIKPGESAKDSTILFNLTMNDEFNLEYTMEWEDRL